MGRKQHKLVVVRQHNKASALGSHPSCWDPHAAAVCVCVWGGVILKSVLVVPPRGNATRSLHACVHAWRRGFPSGYSVFPAQPLLLGMYA